MSRLNDEQLTPFLSFTSAFEEHIKRDSKRIKITLSNIFTMRLVGNKTHGDLAEIAIAEYINLFLEGYSSKHVGKDLYRAKKNEEDVEIIDLKHGNSIPVSLKAYGHGPLQLSTDKKFILFPYLQSLQNNKIEGTQVREVFQSEAFSAFKEINILPLIYDEKKSQCNIMVFDYPSVERNTAKILLVSAGKGRKHPCFQFFDGDDGYIAEVRYGGPAANALQRGLWTNTKRANSYFRSLTGGWITYDHNLDLVRLLSLALNSTPPMIKQAMQDIESKINDE